MTNTVASGWVVCTKYTFHYSSVFTSCSDLCYSGYSRLECEHDIFILLCELPFLSTETLLS
jgi:hypothetical protein